MGKSDINITQTQQIVMGFISPIIDEIVDRVSERVLAASKKEPKFYTRKEAAEILHVTLPTLARITKDGLLISKRVGSRILYEADAIDEAVKKTSRIQISEGMAMKEKKKAASTTANLQHRSGNKDSKSSRIKQQIRKLFLDGGKYTSKDLNTLTGGNDSRKVISDLRKEGWNIKDVRLDDRRKLYWLEPDKRQMSIDWKGGSNE